MRKILCNLLILLIMSSTLISTYAYDYQTSEDAINDANSFLDSKLGIPEYYKLRTNSKDKKTKLNLNPILATKGTNDFSGKQVFVYGENIEASKESTTNGRVQDVKGEYRALGYAIDGSIFANPAFLPDNEGYKATDKRWISEPWGPSNRKDLYGEDGKTYYGKYISSGIEDYIRTWINKSRFLPDNLILALNEPNLNDSEKRRYFAGNALDSPPIKNFENCMYIIQPPTLHVWGVRHSLLLLDKKRGRAFKLPYI